MTMGGSNVIGQFGDTTLTKVFVGGLAWETQKEVLREHFDKYGEILEAVIISDKTTGRSKGYGFVTFKEPEAAKKSCEEATPMINGRRANCNLASLGAKRPRALSTTPQQGSACGPRSTSSPPPVPQPRQVQWYYPAATGTPTASPFHHHHHAVPYHPYGYSPAYITADMSYNHKLGYTGGSYVNGHYSHVYPGQGMMSANTMMPVYPIYPYHQSHTMGGVPSHVYPAISAGQVTTIPTIISKPPPMTASAGSGTAEKASEGS
ncbi:hypothetical protein GIB67_030343 [Kingdonia uniflora]|uniref:RRM domain-containing protein n=1 Tax=Kingdonia uniflora TaxID=39325 RepID=A0A7J7M6S0_9MAGN|nr:hypothetical protein GIB67_030343 [Kingdonia uniflora]